MGPASPLRRRPGGAPAPSSHELQLVLRDHRSLEAVARLESRADVPAALLDRRRRKAGRVNIVVHRLVAILARPAVEADAVAGGAVAEGGESGGERESGREGATRSEASASSLPPSPPTSVTDLSRSFLPNE